jgi:protein-L-isoaspartate(D-aspartate) O-methyltransferase
MAPRHLFVPAQHRDRAYEDIPLPIGCGQTISQPYIVALMTQALRLTRESRVIEVGTGSGYQAAVLAQIAAHVWSVETVPELAATAQARLRDLGYAVDVRVGDGRLGWAEHAPYDAILVAAASPDVPPALAAQLAERGRLVIPIGDCAWDQRLWLIERAGGRLRREYLADVRFVPLIATASEVEAADEGLADVRAELKRLFHDS